MNKNSVKRLGSSVRVGFPPKTWVSRSGWSWSRWAESFNLLVEWVRFARQMVLPERMVVKTLWAGLIGVGLLVRDELGYAWNRCGTADRNDPAETVPRSRSNGGAGGVKDTSERYQGNIDKSGGINAFIEDRFQSRGR